MRSNTRAHSVSCRVVSVLQPRSVPLAILDVRPCARYVAEHARHVLIERDRVARLAAEFELQEGPSGIGPLLDRHVHWLARTDETLAYFVTLGALRFGSGYHTRLAKQAGLSVGQSLLACLKERFETRGPFSIDELLGATKEMCAELFRQPTTDSGPMELMELYARSLREFGAFVNANYGGSCARWVESAGGSAVRLSESCSRMPYFNDVQRYRGLEVAFFQRAQRIAVDLAQAFDLQGPGAFDDLDKLAPSADNVVPHVLRMDGAMRYDRALQERVDHGEAVPAHSEREVEIRACALHVVEMIIAENAAHGRAVTSLQVDSWLRARGRRAYYRTRPRHRSRTVLY